MCGVSYRAADGLHEVRATLTVAADGRFSKLRHLAGLQPVKAAAPMDVHWFRLPRREGEPDHPIGRTGRGHFALAINRGETWQVACVIPKGGYQQLRAAGLEEVRRNLAALIPLLADRVEALNDWKQVSVLSVESSCLRRWYQPGLLFIGDAAHVMSPVGGVGINYAIMDAVATYNRLAGPLLAGSVSVRDLAAVQRRRWQPTRFIQGAQHLLQARVLGTALQGGERQPPVGFLRWRPLRRLVARLIAYGLRREHVRA